MAVEYLDVLTAAGEKTGTAKPRDEVHRDGDYHRAVHTWIYAESTGQLLLQRRADRKDSWPGMWDISSAGHISAGDTSLGSARRELEEELGISLPEEAFELIFVHLEKWVMNEGTFINNEFSDVYLITTLEPIPLEAFSLQESEVSTVKYINWNDYRSFLASGDTEYVPYDVKGEYGQLFNAIEQRYNKNKEECIFTLQKQLLRYTPVHLDANLAGLSGADREALVLIIQASAVIDKIFYEQVWHSNPILQDWLKQQRNLSSLDELKWTYYSINKSPWSLLDENKAFLTTADSAIKLHINSSKPISGWKGIEYRVAFPEKKPQGANFYPSDMDKMEFEHWLNSLSEEHQKLSATGFFSVIRRHNEGNNDAIAKAYELSIIPFSQEYRPLLLEATELLHKAAELTGSSSLKRLLHAKANAFLSNDYYDSDIAWMELDSKLDVTIGPYETYEDSLFGYKATFEAFVGIRDDICSQQIKIFGDNLQRLEQNLPLDDVFKSTNVAAAPIRVIQLIYSSGDVKGPQTVAFNLPNDERLVKERGTSMVMLKNISEAKFKHVLLPIADICINEEQKMYIDFESFFTHTICHECCHGIGPHAITLPNGQQSTVRRELQEVHSALEEAKADIVGLWALKFLITEGLIPTSLLESMYVSFLAGCFRSIRFGLEEAHGKGQALQFNWLFEKGAFLGHTDGTFSVDFSKIDEVVESLSREILTIQAKGDKVAAVLLFQQYAVITESLRTALDNLEKIQVPVDISPIFGLPENIMERVK